ncbi:unnamed protein product [Anisakis simplex]|uniref:Uncharacterized protein n=1 Tax=Anisakis simplex TaxID=6269 RepID=A0A3P6SXX1_ANISI|nr:unnamed protein product [Anisakis simplex]
MKTQCDLYNDIGQIQRNLFTGIQDLIVNPLQTFVMTDSNRILQEISELDERRRDMDIAIDELNRRDFHSAI